MGSPKPPSDAHLLEVRGGRADECLLVVVVGVDGFGVEAAGGVEQGVGDAAEELTFARVEEDVRAGVLLGPGVVVEVPLDVGVAGGAEAHAGDERGDVAGLGEEGDAGERERGVEDVAAAVEDGVAEGGVKEVALGYAPGEPLLLGGCDGLGTCVGFGVGACGRLRSLCGGVGDAVGVGALVGGGVEDVGELGWSLRQGEVVVDAVGMVGQPGSVLTGFALGRK